MNDRDHQAQLELWSEQQNPGAGLSSTPRPPRRGRSLLEANPGPPSALPEQPKPAELPEAGNLWAINAVADYLGVPKQTIYAWRQKGYGPQGFRVGKYLRWRPETVGEWTLALEREQRR